MNTKEMTTAQKEKLAGSSKTSVKKLTELSTDESGVVRWAVAGNSKASVEILTKLSTDKNEYVRYKAVSSPKVPLSILTDGLTLKEIRIQLAIGSLPIDIKRKLAFSPNTPIGIRQKLSSNEDREILQARLWNPSAAHLLM